MSCVKTFNITEWQSEITPELATKATELLESGHVLLFPQLKPHMKKAEEALLDASLVDPSRKNISYTYATDNVVGMNVAFTDSADVVRSLMQRYAKLSQQLVTGLFPHYRDHLQVGRTSLRVLDTASKVPPSYRKDDSRLHVDAFPATPMQGKRILRVFQNINPYGVARKWRVGEPFPDLVRRFQTKLTSPIFGARKLMYWLKMTKEYRSLYDHYMLQLHNKMKKDMAYQRSVPQEAVSFLPGSVWIVFSDQVSHAAMAGQHMLEQTFYLDAQCQMDPGLSPIEQLRAIV